MTEEVRCRIFEPFYTTKEVGKGTGLGLSMVYGIVQEATGQIVVSSQPGRGSKFQIYLPHAAAPAPAGTDSCLSAAKAGQGETVLVVEDEDAVRGLICEELETRGYSVVSASDGRAALEVSRQFAGPIDLLVTDMVMPRMSGKELSDAILLERPQIKILYVSGYTNTTVDPALLLRKPFAAQDLARAVRRVLDPKDAGPEPAFKPAPVPITVPPSG
jgi:CheY-like chemotaxis protein